MDTIYNEETGLTIRNKLNANFAELRELIEALQGSLVPQGNWNASTNTPDITGETETGYYWIVDVEGSTDIGGITDWKANDWIVKTATGWAKVDNTELITSVAGKTGDVILSKADVGLANVDNTSDADKPISDATQNALDDKADSSDLANKADKNNVLEKNNTVAFIPTKDYHPATKKYVEDNVATSGTWTPTISDMSNIADITALTSIFTRIGNVVAFSAHFEIEATAVGRVYFDASLPISSTLTSREDVVGVANTRDDAGLVTAKTADNEMRVDYTESSTTGLRYLNVVGQYVVK